MSSAANRRVPHTELKGMDRSSLPHEGKTVAKSFRIDQNALGALQEEARKQQISLNTLVNQLLVGYSEYGRFIRHMNGVSISGGAFFEFLSNIPEDRMIEIGRKLAKSALVTLVTSRYGKMGVDGVIEWIHRFSSYANLYEYSETEEKGRWTITLTHGFGRKWSLFLAGYFEQAFADVGVKTTHLVSEASTTFSI